MKLGTKVILINLAIVVGLLLESYWGRPLTAITISAVILFLVANATFLFLARRTSKRADRKTGASNEPKP